MTGTPLFVRRESIPHEDWRDAPEATAEGGGEQPLDEIRRHCPADGAVAGVSEKFVMRNY
jgi:hypothetical protein